jgi:hypothetical protein
MAKPHSSRLAPTALAVFGIVVAGVLGVLLGVVREAGWLSLLLSIAFALAPGGNCWRVAGVDSSISAETVASVFVCFGSDHLRGGRVSDGRRFFSC